MSDIDTDSDSDSDFTNDDSVLQSSVEECGTEDEEIFMELPKTTVSKVEITPKIIVRSLQTAVNNTYAKLKSAQDSLTNQLSAAKTSKKRKSIEAELENTKEGIRKFVKRSRNINTVLFKEAIVASVPKNFEYFRKFLSNNQQCNMICNIYDLAPKEDKPTIMRIMDTPIKSEHKVVLIKFARQLESAGNSEEGLKVKNWLDTCLSIPFGNYAKIPVSLVTDGEIACAKFIQEAKQTLDDCMYGMHDTKMEIIQLICMWITNPTSIGKAIALHGPAGVGKTSIVKNGISKILNRFFGFISLGGISDATTLTGTPSVYVGAKHGAIIETVIAAKHMNPIIYFDELDKVSHSDRGAEIIGTLIHLTDSTQNDSFHDRFFAELDFDLSKCLYMFSYNDESAINPILKDRLHKIHVKGYSTADKVAIARKHLLPIICKQYGFSITDVEITDSVLEFIVNSCTCAEQGVRNLKNILESIYGKLNLFRFFEPKSDVFETQVAGSKPKSSIPIPKVEWPFKLTTDIVRYLIRTDVKPSETWRALYN